MNKVLKCDQEVIDIEDKEVANSEDSTDSSTLRHRGNTGSATMRNMASARPVLHVPIDIPPFLTILFVAMLPFICLALFAIHPLALFAFVACAIIIADRNLIDRERNHSPIPYQ